MKRRITLLAITLSVIVGWSNIATAQCTIDQSQLLTNAGRSARNLAGYYEGQTFTAGATGLLCEIDLQMFNTMTGTGTLKIYSGSGISGTLLTSQSVNVNVPSMTSVWQNWTISSPPLVTNGSVYTFQFIPTQGGGLPDPYGVNVQTSNVYSGGHDLADINMDLTFRTHINITTTQCAIDQSQLLTNAGRSARNLAGYYEGQTFTAGTTGLLCEIDLQMFNTMTGTGTLKIYSGSGISGTLLTTQSVNVNVPSMTSVWQNWTISSPPLVTNGSVYTFQFIPTQGGGLPDPYGVNVQTSNVYSGGHDLADINMDLTFSTYVDVATSINDIHTENNFVVFPNPSYGKFILNSNRNITSIEIFNYLGEKAYATIVKQQTSNEIDLSNSSKGIYFVRLTDDNENIHTEKIIIQ